MLTLLDFKKQEEGIGHDIIVENMPKTPELAVFPVYPMDGDVMTLTVQTGIPDGSFRAYNEGVTEGKGTFENRTFTAFPLDKKISVDKALVENKKPATVQRTLMANASAVYTGQMVRVCKQIWEGTTKGDKKGFPGIVAQYKADDAHQVNAGDSTNKTSVYFIELGEEKVELVTANGKTVDFYPDWKEGESTDSKGNPYEVLYNYVRGGMGLRVANRDCVVRIHSIGDGEGEGLTYQDMKTAYRKCLDLGMNPTHIFMNPRTAEQYWNLFGVDADGKVIKMPIEFMNIPFVITPHISNAE
ncbi:MAG: major capsid protein [Puniceicoccaceae bacterium]